MAADGNGPGWRVPRFEVLEDRIVLDAVPDVAIEGPGSVDIGAQDVPFTLTFDNTGTDSGYVPYVDLILPTTGSDGDDGVTFDSASFLGEAIDTTLITFDGAGQAIHPFAVDAIGNPIVVNGTPGDTLVVLELPYGSFSPGNPPVDIDLVLDFSNLADLDDTFAIEAIGGFAFGEDPLNNPTADAPIRGAPTTETVGQDLFSVTKASTAPENDAATGPSYPYQYNLFVDVAAGQTLTDFVLTDTLPPEIVYLGGVSISGAAGTITTEPPVGALVTAPNNQLVIEFAAISAPVTVIFDFYIEESGSDTTDPVIPVNSGDSAPIINSVTGNGTWDPLDGRDPPVAISDGFANEITARSLAVQKSNAVIFDDQAAGPTPGDIYEFTLNVQVSDYFTYGDLIVTDILGNGWEYQAGSASFTFVEEGGGSAVATALAPTFETSTFNPTTGETTNEWDISAAMASLPGEDGLLTGDIAGDGTSSETSTTVQITYRATILDEYPGSVPGNSAVSQGDLLSNSVTVEGTVRDNASPATVLGTEEETSSNEIALVTGAIESKEVYALNGSTSFDPTVPIAAGDEVTFAVTYRAPLGSFEDLTIVDNLPQNVFESTEVTVFNAVANGTPPAAGEAQFGPADEFFPLAGVIPSLSIDGPNNGVTFDFSDLSVDPRQEVDVQFLFTVTVVDALFDQDLRLTNQATAFETDSFGNTIDTTAVAQFTYSEPLLEITKGVVAFDAQDSDAALDGPAGPVAFTAPPATGTRFSGTINSAGLDTTPIDANIDNIDAGDTVTFAIVVENVGTAPNGAFDVRITDTIPAGFVVPTTAAALNLNVSDGTGAAIALEPGSAPLDLFGAGIELQDDALEGSVAGFDATAGDNVVIITYDLVVDDAVTANQTMTNTAEITNYNATENQVIPGQPQVNRVPPAGLSDDAIATTEDIDIDKAIFSRQFGEGGANEVLVGEDLSYIITIDLIEGTLDNAIFTDTATQPAVPGLEILGGEIVSIGSTITNTAGLTVGDTVAASGNTVTFNFGDLTVASDNIAGNETIEIRVDARVPDDQVGNANQFLQNRARLDWDGGRVQDFQGARLTEPNLTLDKTAGPATVRAGDTVNYSVAIDNIAGFRDAPAYDLRLTDTLDPNVLLDGGSIQILLDGTDVTGSPGYAVNVSGPNDFEVIVDVLEEGESLVVNYEAEVIAGVVSGVTIDNTADVTFDSTPEDEGVGTSAADDSDDRDYSLTDTAEVATATAEIAKDVVASSNPDTVGTDLAIGEEVTFEIVVTLPEGNSEDVVLQDVLPTTPGTLQFVSANVVSIGDNITGPDLPPTITNAGATTTFDFGDLNNFVDLTLDPDDLITVQVTALVTDIAANEAGDALTNTATLFFTDGNGNPADVSDTATVDLVEPSLDIDKVASPTTGDAGDVITYTVTSTNSGDAPAYDIVIDDDLAAPGIAALPTGTLTIRILDGATDVTPGGADAPTVAFSGGALQAVVPVLGVGETIEIVYQGTITDAALFSTPVPNSAEVTRFDSDPAGGPTDENGRVYDEDLAGYTVPSDDAEVLTPDASLTKTLVGTSDPNTAGSDVAVGELLTYELEITVPQGTADLTLTDVLPDGLAAQTATFLRIDNDPGVSSDITVGSSQSGVGTTDDITIAANGDSVTFDFGTVTVTGENDAAAVDTVIVVQVTALVEDVAAVTDGADLQNTATLEVVDPANPGTDLQPDVQATETVTVIEPVLDIAKAASPTTGDAGDVITYTVNSSNTGNAPAYDIVIDDDLSDTGLAALTTGTLTIRILDGATDVTPTGADAPTVAFSGGALQAIIPVLDVGQTIEIVYQATVTDAALFSSPVPNTAAVTRFDTDPAGGPTDDNGRVFDATRPGYTVPTDDAEVQTPDASLTKTLIGTSDATTPGDEVGVGEVVTYELVVTVPQGTADLTLTDVLPDGLAAQTATFVRIDNDPGVTSDIAVGAIQTGVGTTDDITIATNGDSVTFDFGTVTVTGENDAAATDTQIVVQVTALVEDVAAVTDGAILQNTATLEVVDPASPGTDLQPDVQATETVTVVEPEVTLVKASPIGANPGDTVPYTITLINTGTGPAYDLQVVDTLADATLSLATGTIEVFLNTVLLAPQPSVTETAPDGFVVAGLTLEPGDTIVIEFDVTLDALAPPAQTFLNTATATFDTVDDGDPNSSTGRQGTATDTEDLSTVPILNKDPVASSFPETDSTAGSTPFELSVGEEVTYRYELIFPEVPMDAVVLVDSLPEGMQFVSSAVIPGGVPYSGSPTVTVDANQRDLTFDFGPINNPSDGSIGADDVLTFEVTARVIDVAAATAGATLTNDALLTITPQGEPPLDTQPASADVVIVEPLLTLDKSGPLVVEPGGTVTYTLEITNTGPVGGSAGPAYDVIITDSLPPEIALNPASLSFSDGSVVVNAATATGFTATLPVLDDGQTLTVTYSGTLSPAVTAPQSFQNTATVDYDSAPGNNPDERDYPQLTDDHRVATPPLLDKTILSTSLAETGSGAFNPANPDVNIGEEITYELVITLPEIPTDGVVLTDTLPTGLSFVSADIVSVGSEITGVTDTDEATVISTAGQNVIFNFGAIENTFSDGVIDTNDEIRVTVTVRVDDLASVNAGDVLTNDANLVLTPQGEPALPPVQDDVSVDVVEPAVTIDKVVSDPEPDAGDTITYTVTVTNDPAATGPALNLVVTDPLPTDLTLTGTVTTTGAGASVTSGTGSTLVIAIPLLQPGETVTITYDVFVGFATPVLDNVVNVATVTGTTSGDPGDPGRPILDDDDAVIEVAPAPELVIEDRPRLVGGGIDDAQFLPILLIDPIYTGTAEYGSNVTVTLYQWDGSLSYVRNIVADAGGHWIAIFPRVTLDNVDDDFHEAYQRSVLFRKPVDYLDNRVGFDRAGAPITQREFFVGTQLDDDSYTVRVDHDRPSTLPQDRGMFNARVFFAPATIGEPYARGDVLSVDEVFEGVADLSVERLYAATVDPLATGLNRFSYEFLAEDTAIPGGSAR
ncbi:MAG: isopeptide-forming domain-containing fimbrial protein [Pseudomonadota bacterium]